MNVNIQTKNMLVSTYAQLKKTVKCTFKIK